MARDNQPGYDYVVIFSFNDKIAFQESQDIGSSTSYPASDNVLSCNNECISVDVSWNESTYQEILDVVLVSCNISVLYNFMNVWMVRS